MEDRFRTLYIRDDWEELVSRYVNGEPKVIKAPLIKMKPCPFCGGALAPVVVNEEGDWEPIEFDALPPPGYKYTIMHYDFNEMCPLAKADITNQPKSDKRDPMSYTWDSCADMLNAINKRPPDRRDSIIRFK